MVAAGTAAITVGFFKTSGRYLKSADSVIPTRLTSSRCTATRLTFRSLGFRSVLGGGAEATDVELQPENGAV